MNSQDFIKYKDIDELRLAIGLSNITIAKKWAEKHVPKEKDYQAKIIAYLKKRFPKAKVWKQSLGSYSSQNGLPDVAMVLDGRYYGFEVKRPFLGKVTKKQELSIKELRKAGAVAEVVTYVEEVKIIMDKLLLEGG